MSRIPYYVATAMQDGFVFRLFHVGNFHYQIVEFVQGCPADGVDLPETDFERACSYLASLAPIVHTRYNQI